MKVGEKQKRFCKTTQLTFQSKCSEPWTSQDQALLLWRSPLCLAATAERFGHQRLPATSLSHFCVRNYCWDSVEQVQWTLQARIGSDLRTCGIRTSLVSLQTHRNDDDDDVGRRTRRTGRVPEGAVTALVVNSALLTQDIGGSTSSGRQLSESSSELVFSMRRFANARKCSGELRAADGGVRPRLPFFHHSLDSVTTITRLRSRTRRTKNERRWCTAGE